MSTQLAAYPGIDCKNFDGPWSGMFAGSFFLFLFFFFFVNMFFLVILKDVDETNERKQHRYGFIFGKYQKDYNWWEVLLNVKKTLLVLFAVFLSEYGIVQAATALAIILIHLVAQLTCKPYHEETKKEEGAKSEEEKEIHRSRRATAATGATAAGAAAQQPHQPQPQQSRPQKFKRQFNRNTQER